MFGLGKETIPVEEFGLWVLKYADGFISNDACRSLAVWFPEGYDASNGWVPVFERHNIAISTVKLYLRQYTHCVLQSVFKAYPEAQRRAMVQGAISALEETPPGYEFGRTFNSLEAVFDGSYRFDPSIEPLNDDGRLNYLSVPNIHILASKYLIDTFVLDNIRNRKELIDNFGLYSSTVATSLALTNNAVDTITSKVKIGT